jgi:hypothetical protein
MTTTAMTTTAMERDLFAFATELLERGGGAVDWADPHEPGEAIVPADLVRNAQLPGEEFSLALGATRVSCGMQVSLASDFLDVAARILTETVPNTGSFCVGDRYLKKRDLEEAIGQTFDWPNARVRCSGEAAATRVEYHQWTLHARIQSDDLWESLVSVTLNSASGAVLNLPNLAELNDLAPAESGDRVESGDREEATGDGGDDVHVPSHAPPQDTESLALKFGRTRMLEASADFVRRIEQRLERDRKRLQDYYRALSREATPKTRKGVTPPSAEEIAAKKKAVDLELRRKLGELAERYALRAELRPLVLLRVLVPALAVPLLVQRKQATRTYTVYWNSLLKKFEPLRCVGCCHPTSVVHFANDTVDPYCPTCFAAPHAG